MNKPLLVFVIIALEVFLKGVVSRKVDITGSTTGMKGSNETTLKCLFTKDNGDYLNGMTFLAMNIKNFEQLLLLRVGRPTAYSNLWYYLFGNVTLEQQITDSSTEVHIQINRLLCKHEREYKCAVIFDPGNIPIIMVSDIINITVQVKPSNPESIQLLGKLVDKVKLSTTEYQPKTESEKNEAFTTNIPTQKNYLNISSSITEGDKIIITCSGSVGKPPANFKWEKIQSSGAITTYDDTNTDIIYHSENCSFLRTSNITLQMFAEDNNATVKCVVVESDISDDKLYAETDPIEVVYKVRLPNITKQPNKDIYGKETKNITLTCHSDGNPNPSYVWSKNGNIIHNKSVMVISNVTVNDIGTYVCNVSNYVDNDQIMYSTAVSIVIVEEIVTTSKRTTTLSIADGTIEVRAQDNNTNTNVYIIVGVVLAVVLIAVVAVGTVYKYNQHRNKYRQKRNEGQHDYVNNEANLTSSNYDDLGVMMNESHYDEIKHNKHLYTNISPQ